MSSTFFPHKMRLENVKEKNPIIISCACSLLMITSSCKKGGKCNHNSQWKLNHQTFQIN